MEIVESVLASPVAVTVVIIVLGVWLGRAKLAGMSLGSSGVLFIAILFGAAGWVHAETRQIDALGQFGVVLFVYAIGLQAGPRFVRTVRDKGVLPLLIGVGTVAAGALAAVVTGKLLGVEDELTVGVFAGALTSTPALAAAAEATGNSPVVSVAYGLAYPFGVVAVVLFAQLTPRCLKRPPSEGQTGADRSVAEEIHNRCYLVQNPACVGKRLSELSLHQLVTVNISRVLRGTEVLPSGGDVKLQRGDIVMAVGIGRELDRLALIIGPPVPAEVELSRVPNVVARDVYISEAGFSGRTLRQLHVRSRFNVVITRVRRESMDFVPRGEFVLEVGDLVRVVGYEPDVQSFVAAAGLREQRIHETGIPQFAFGLALGLVIGFVPLPIPGLGRVTLGLAGGPLLAGLLFGHFGRIGRLRIHVPVAARYLMRELGLVLFLVSAGISAGARMLGVLQEQGVTLVIVSVVTVLVAIATGFGLAYVAFRQSLPSTLGMTCGAMTSTPGLGAASAQYESDTPALSYAAVYPLALVAMTVAAQGLVALLRVLR